MDLTKLFEMQKKLDRRIVKEKGLEGQNLLDKKILALQVELGELANEWRGFKFWSEDQEPRIENRLLEEYVDCLHFILSIGIELNFTDIEVWSVKEKFVANQFIECFGGIYHLYFQIRVTGEATMDTYECLFAYFIGLGEMLGFNWEQIEQAYLKKNKINHERQNKGY